MRHANFLSTQILKNLTELRFNNTFDITDQIIIKLSQLPMISQLTTLQLSRLKKITPSSLIELFSSSYIRRIQILNLRSCHALDDQVIEIISKTHLEKLISLDISDCKLITNQSMKHLSKMKAFKYIEYFNISKCYMY